MSWLTLLVWTAMAEVPLQDETVAINPWYLRDLELRQKGMHQYFLTHFGPNPPLTLEPKMVVIHWTAVPSAQSTWNTFASATLGGRKDIRAAGDVNVGAHFLVDRDGTIHQLLPENHFARHCIGVNHIAIGIENVGGTPEFPLTEEQLNANVMLIRDLQTRHEIDVVVGHYEIRHFESHPYFQELNPKYRSIKSDPGEMFMQQLRVKMVTVENPNSAMQSLGNDLNK